MKFRVGACALLVCLAGCTAEAPDTKFGNQRGTASTNSRTAQRLPLVQVGRQASQSVANAPDRGELISYKNKGAAIKREGAYTWYPVAISEAHALKAVVDGVMSIPSPDGSQVKVRYERHVESPDGNWTWIGRVIGGDQEQEAILTFGEDAVYGSIPQMAGAPLSLQTRGGQLYAVQTDLSKVKNPNNRTDMMVPPAQALRSSLLAQASKAQVSQSAIETKAATAATTVDVAIGYTAGFAAAQGGQSAAVTRLVFLVEVGNQAFENSLITGAIRVVNALQINYTDTTTNKAALAELTGRNENNGVVTIPASLVPLRDAREQYGADLAILVRNFQTPENDGCGIAWLNGSGQLPIDPATDDDYGFAVISDGNDTGSDGNSYFCAPETLIHELGHLMGSAHDRDNSKKADGSQLFGRYPYSFGMKTDAANGNFYTIMAYGDNNQNFYRTFSNPLVVKCGPSNNLACGVADQTDNARSLNQTIPVVAQFRVTVVPIAGGVRRDINGDGNDDLLWHNTLLSRHGLWLMNGSSILQSPNFAAAAGFTIAAEGDFTGDNRMDVMWVSPQRDMWLLSSTGAAFSDGKYISTYPVGWKMVSTGDVNGDGTDDLIWHNSTTAEYGYWLMNGGSVSKVFSAKTGPGYRLVTTGYFNSDAFLDMVWTSNANDLVMLFGNGNTFTDSKIGNYPDAGRIFGAGDVNGDGKDDLLLLNKTNNTWGYWVMDGSRIVTSSGFSAGPGYFPVSVGDFNGDSRIDVMWSSPAADLQLLSSNGSSFVYSYVGAYGTTSGWKPIDTGVAAN